MFIDINANRAYQEGLAAGKAKSLNKRLRPKNPYKEPEKIGMVTNEFFGTTAVYASSEWSEWARGYEDGLNTCPQCGQLMPKDIEERWAK